MDCVELLYCASALKVIMRILVWFVTITVSHAKHSRKYTRWVTILAYLNLDLCYWHK